MPGTPTPGKSYSNLKVQNLKFLLQNNSFVNNLKYRTSAISGHSQSMAAPLRIHAKSNFLPHFYVTIWGVKK